MWRCRWLTLARAPGELYPSLIALSSVDFINSIANSRQFRVMTCGWFLVTSGTISRWNFVSGLLFIRNNVEIPLISFIIRISFSSILLKLNSFTLKSGVIDSNFSGLRRFSARSLFSYKSKNCQLHHELAIKNPYLNEKLKVSIQNLFTRDI